MKILKVICLLVGALILLLISACLGVYFYLTPGRIASIIEKESRKHLAAEVKVARVDYSLFKSFPWLEVTIDSLEIISNTLDPLPADIKTELPPNSSFLASVRKAEAELNLKALLKDEILVKQIEITEPKLNIVIASDSINNFSIMPELPKKINLPEIRIEEIRVLPPIDIKFFSIPDSTSLSAGIDRFNFSEKGKTEFNVDVAAILQGHIKGISIPGEMKVGLTLSSVLRMPSPSLDISNLQVNVMGIDLWLKSGLSLHKDHVSVDSARINVSTDNLFGVIEKIPEPIADKITLPAGLSGHLPLHVDCELLSPYNLDYTAHLSVNSIKIPSLRASAGIDDAQLRYAPPGEKPLDATDVYLDADICYDPAHPDKTAINLTKFRLSGEGVTLEASGAISNLTQETQHLALNAKFGSKLMKTLSCLLPQGGIKTAGHIEGEMLLSADAADFGKSGLKDIMLKGDITSKTLVISQGKKQPEIKTEKLKTDLEAFLPSYPPTDYTGTRLKLDVLAGALEADDGKGVNLVSEGLDLNLTVYDKGTEDNSPLGEVSMKMKTLALKEQSINFHANGIGLTLKGHPKSDPSAAMPSFAITGGTTDEEILEKIPHTPLYLENQGAGLLSTLINMADIDATLTLKGGNLQIPQYLYPVELSNLSLSTDLNRYNISASRIGIGRSSFALGAVAEGIGNFLTSYDPVPLKAEADFSFNDVDINQLSWGYYGAALKAGNDSVWQIPPMTPFTAADSLCVLIPRNIDARISLRSQQAHYMQYSFSPLSTDIILKAGNATLNRLTIGAPYGNVAVDWTYSTEKADNIYMSLKADVERFNFKSFYSVFPQTTGKAPELENLTGDLYLSATGRFLMYPTMFMNAPSLQARFNIKGNNLQFARHGKVETITHLMLIKGDGPIHIDNIDIEGAFHDNMLQVNPFKIKFEDYQLGFGGLNNMQGDIYYHLALEKSPFHMPFGVNLEGSFKHPEVRLGGTKIDEKQGEKISSGLEWNPSINIMAYLKHGWLIFVEEAAKYAQKNEK